MWGVAAEATGPADALIYAVWAFLGIVVTTLGTIAVQGLKSRADRQSTTSSPPTPAGPVDMTRHAERIAVLEHRADDSDDRDAMHDRRHESAEDRLDRIERFHDHNDPSWRDC